MSNKVIVLGIDGATFRLLRPWIEAGKLPNLAHVLREGTFGSLRSTIPPYSAQAWVSMMTGRSPAKHGIVDFFQQQAGSTQHRFISSTSIHGEAVWDILNRHGKSVGAVNVPLTYPPAHVNGYMVSGFMTPKGRADYAYPAELRQEILGVTGEYDPDPWDLLSRNQGLPGLAHWMEIAEHAARHLHAQHSVDLFVNVIQALDQLQHLFWDVLTNPPVRSSPEGARFWPTIEHCYQTMDEAIGERFRWLDDDTTLFLVSDHGFQHVDSWFNVNAWLAQSGFLAFAGRPVSRLGLTRESVKTLVRRLDVLGLRRFVGRFTRAAIADKLDDTLARPIDWSQTVAYSGSRTSEGIWINVKGREPQGVVEPGAPYEQVRAQIMAALNAAVDPRTGQPAVGAAYRREDVHQGEFLAQMPDILFSLDDKPYLTSDRTTALQIFAPLSKDDVRGRHHSLGIFAALGKHVIPGQELAQASIVDVAPTLLYAMDVPIPADMDGHVLETVFTPKYRQTHPVRYEGADGRAGDAQTPAEVTVYTDEEDAEMQRRLQGLGYLS
jgi:predicted AlkP superfamily phosphohydrolase/phosphomutase